MAKEKINLKKELQSYRFDFNLWQKIPCSKEDNKKYEQLLKKGGPLPEGVFPYIFEESPTNEFYTIDKNNLTESEKQEYLRYNQLTFLKTIKNCVLFFTILAVISLVICLFAFIS